jgi:type IV pilus assembly protein PilC
VQALDILTDQAPDSGSKAIFGAIKEKVSSGSYLWEALALYPRAFPRLYISLVRAGEASGSTDQMLKRLSRYLEDSHRMKKIVKSASMYPILVTCIAACVITVMMVVVIPRFETMLSTNGEKLPELTQIVINLSKGMQNNFGLILAVVVGGIYLLRRYFESEEGRATLDRAVFDLPYMGPLMQKAGVARFSRTLQTLLASGVNLIDAIEVCRGTIDNAVLESAIDRIKNEIEGGKTLGQVISKLPVFPKMTAQMISVGESTGNLDKMLDKIAACPDSEPGGAFTLVY